MIKLGWAKNILQVSFVFTLVASSLMPAIAYGSISPCSAYSSLNSFEPGPTLFQLTVINTSDSVINWIKITHPTDNFTINSSNSPGWDSSNDQTYAYEANGTLDIGSGAVVDLNVQVADQISGPDNWTIDTSNDGGNTTTACVGALDASIVASSTPPNLYNVSISNLKTTSLTLNWTTDKPSTSQVNYGSDSNYGTSTSADLSLVTSHSVNITELTMNTVYHYQLLSDDGNGNVGTSSDNTFITPTTDPVVVEPTNHITPSITPSIDNTLSNFGVPIKAVPTERVPPTIALTTSFAKPFKQAPIIQGTAADNDALAVIEYSTDGGKNWLPVDTATGLGGKSATYSFTPLGLDDGNYSVMTRAIDTSGNVGSTPAETLVIDRLDPLVGGNLLSQGPQILMPNANGTIISMAGIDQKITLSAVGGPTSITLSSQLAGGRNKAQIYNLTKSADTGLWSGVISFVSPGQYDLTANAVDGAGNKTVRLLSKVDVSSPARTTNQKTHKPVGSTVTLYYLEPNSHSWVVWDGASYGQVNPQPTDKQGNFELFLPPGKYYLKAQAPGYETLTSSIFETKQSTPLTSNLALKPLRKIGIGSLKLSFPSFPMFAVQKIDIAGDRLVAQDKTSQSNLSAALIGKPAPDFALADTSGATIHAANLLGRPTLITFGATWSPTTTEQLAILSQLQADKDINIVPIALQEGSAKVQAFTSIANLDLRWLVDPDSTLSNSYRVQNLPTHYFLDRKGTIQRVLSGVLTKQQILDILGSY